jgi:DNA polymerase-3 subunit alpha
VAQIITFSTIKGKQAIRDAARVLGHPYGVGDRAAKLMPPAILGKDATLTQCLEDPGREAPQADRDHYQAAAGLRELYESDAITREVVDTARGLEGLRRQDSIHAAAVVISPDPLTDVVPLQQKGDGAEIVTQYEMHAVESLGLLKMDFLGLRTLTTIERALDLIERNSGTRPDIDSVPLDDPAVFEMLQRGDTMGIFQFEGGPMRALMRNLKPEVFGHLVALNALYRPGPLGAGMHTEYADRKNGRAPIEYEHPDLEEILSDTFGIMVYQEQVMQTAQKMAGFSMAEADMLRKAMGKKIPAVMKEQEEKFVAGCVAQGHPEKLGRRIHGIPVAGRLDDLRAVIRRHRVAEVIVAIASAPRKVVTEVVEKARAAGVDFKIVPRLSDVISGATKVSEVKEIQPLPDTGPVPGSRQDAGPGGRNEELGVAGGCWK